MGSKIVFKPKGLGFPIPEELEDSWQLIEDSGQWKGLLLTVLYQLSSILCHLVVCTWTKNLSTNFWRLVKEKRLPNNLDRRYWKNTPSDKRVFSYEIRLWYRQEWKISTQVFRHLKQKTPL